MPIGPSSSGGTTRNKDTSAMMPITRANSDHAFLFGLRFTDTTTGIGREYRTFGAVGILPVARGVRVVRGGHTLGLLECCPQALIVLSLIVLLLLTTAFD